MSKRVYVIVGSMRAHRLGPEIAGWVVAALPPDAGFTTELVDLMDWPLPMSDEPNTPASGKPYLSEHTKAWSEKIAAADGFVFVTPQYNWGYPASLKNALDHLYKEWSGKPAAIVSYGIRGGVKAAAQLQQILEGGLKMRMAATMPAVTFTWDMLAAPGRLRDPAADFAQFAPMIAQMAGELAALLAAPS
jgi:NAD(P)H-dependent FMN reductase